LHRIGPVRIRFIDSFLYLSLFNDAEYMALNDGMSTDSWEGGSAQPVAEIATQNPRSRRQATSLEPATHNQFVLYCLVNGGQRVE
jgi:hypothetical protein